MTLAAEGGPGAAALRVLATHLRVTTPGSPGRSASETSTTPELTNALIDAHSADPEFGDRFLADELERTGHFVGSDGSGGCASQERLWSATVRKGRRGSDQIPGPAVQDDHLQREFSAPGPDRCWSPASPSTRPPTGRSKNVLDRRRWRTRDELHGAIALWIEHTFDRRRRQRALGNLTRIKYELAFTAQDAAVAA